MYSVEQINVFTVSVATILGRYGHHQGNAIQKLKKAGLHVVPKDYKLCGIPYNGRNGRKLLPLAHSCVWLSTYRVIQEESALLWEMIVW
jgi:hypothetical protein